MCYYSKIIIFGEILAIHTIVQREKKWPWSAFENVLYLSIVGVVASNLLYMSSNKQCHYQVPNLKDTYLGNILELSTQLLCRRSEV